MMVRGINTTKLLVLAILGFCAMILGSAVLTLQMFVTQERVRLNHHSKYKYNHDNHQSKSKGITGNEKSGDRQDHQQYDTLNAISEKDRLAHRLQGIAAKYIFSKTQDGSSSSSSSSSTHHLSQGDIGMNKNDDDDDHHLHSPSNARPTKTFTPTNSNGGDGRLRANQVVQTAYWSQASRHLVDWDIISVLESSYDEANPLFDHEHLHRAYNGTMASFALQQAAKEGHPYAQYLLANAYASGIWPFSILDHEKEEKSDGSLTSSSSFIPPLQVLDEWASSEMIPSSTDTATADTTSTDETCESSDAESESTSKQKRKQIEQLKKRQITKAWMLWHTAAIGGNVEAALALGYRIAAMKEDDASGKEESDALTTVSSRKKRQKDETGKEDQDGRMKYSSSCDRALPYFEAAAHAIMDQLEASPHSRAKVIPPMDKHSLNQVHMHGGTSSQLNWDNKPHESKEAIQFYHLKATTVPWSAKMGFDSNNDGTTNAANAPSIDVHAAYTLAHLYHYGLRGVPQNLTQSLFYYEIAAEHYNIDAAGEAGKMYLWGMGTAQNWTKAHEYFKQGAPDDKAGCRRRHEQVKAKQRTVTECDETSLNGLGVLHLMGIPNELPIDVVEAEKYFALAAEMGHADAMYHLAMMWLGWKTHFKRVVDLKDSGVSTDPIHAHLDAKRETPVTFALHYSERTQEIQKGPTRDEIQQAMKLLTGAANKGHVQAKHRLAMIYSQGIKIQNSDLVTYAIKPNCALSKGLYQWITTNANPIQSQRLTKAYQAYMSGDLEVSLRNYLAVAETGSEVGQVNAAFLLERGVCLDLSPIECAKASVRLWKAAAALGIPEAYLRVGDFYYYGRLRESSNFRSNRRQGSLTSSIGPFDWVQYFLFPEESLSLLWKNYFPTLKSFIHSIISKNDSHTDATTFSSSQTPYQIAEEEDAAMSADLSMAAHFYSEAAEKYQSSRANYNLGFLYEYGLGLKQDFPLAKRHYDLAVSVGEKKEAELAVQIALWTMSLHERWVKWKLSWETKASIQRDHRSNTESSNGGEGGEQSALSEKFKSRKFSNTRDGNEFPQHLNKKSAQDVILSHIFNTSSLMIVFLGYLIFRIQKIREGRRMR